ncbi:hypothetical protein LCGC14_2710960, partial [marine sediment metagenome]
IELKDTASLIISSRPVINSIGKTNETTCISDDGTISITATDDYPLIYSINGGNDYFDNGGSFSALSNGNYQVVVMNSNDCETSGGIIEILSEDFIPPAPIAGKDTTYCIGDEIKDLYAIASSGGTLTWYSDPGLTTAIGTGASFNPGSLSAKTSFYVTETSNGCESLSNEVTVEIRNTPPYEDEKICMVTIDLNTGKNLIIWEKTPEVGTQYFNIYREGSLIGTNAYHELSLVKDTVADPEIRPYLYYLTTVDSCGNESALSPYHKPLFLQYISSQDGVNLRWSNYVIESGNVTFENYAIYRGGDSINLSPFAENIPTAIDVYTDIDATALTKRYYYRVAGVLTDPCNPTGDKKAGTGPYLHSLSNMDDNKLKTNINELLSEYGLTIYPNPATENFIIKFSNPHHENYQLILSDLTGKVLRTRDGITEDQVE